MIVERIWIIDKEFSIWEMENKTYRVMIESIEKKHYMLKEFKTRGNAKKYVDKIKKLVK